MSNKESYDEDTFRNIEDFYKVEPSDSKTLESSPGVDDIYLNKQEKPNSLRGVTIDDLLRIVVDNKASDLHISCDKPPKMRVDGDLKNINNYEPITNEWIEWAMVQIATETQIKKYSADAELDFSHKVENYGRFRVNFFKQQGTPAAVFRTIPTLIKTIEELKLPSSLNDLCRRPNGLILVTGPTGSGKSTSLAAMIESRNRMYEEHIMTIEDPVEFVYQSKLALINQREVGADTRSFPEALKRVLRQDPDVILIGELRDPETISIALTAAETGHLVFGTLHTQSAAKSVNRIIDSFPSHQQNQVRTQLGDTLQAIISQTLLKRKGGGRVASTEILTKTPATSSMIRDGKVSQLYSSLQTGSAYGMHTLDQDLVRLLKEGLIEKETAAVHMLDHELLSSVV